MQALNYIILTVGRILKICLRLLGFFPFGRLISVAANGMRHQWRCYCSHFNSCSVYSRSAAAVYSCTTLSGLVSCVRVRSPSHLIGRSGVAILPPNWLRHGNTKSLWVRAFRLRVRSQVTLGRCRILRTDGSSVASKPLPLGLGELDVGSRMMKRVFY